MPVKKNEEYLAVGFREVDSAAVKKIVKCLDFMQSLDSFQRYKARSLDLLALDATSQALDVACGLGG